MKLILFFLLVPLKLTAAIYGENDLVQISTLLNPTAQAVALLAPNNFLSYRGSDVDLLMAPMKETSYVCEDNAWSELRSLPVACTAFLIAPDLMLTAGHCMLNFGEVKNQRTPQCEAFSFVFDVTFVNGNVRASVPAENVVECETVIHARHLSKPQASGRISFDDDFAIVKLKHPVSRKPLGLSKTSEEIRSNISFLGYPLGTGLFQGTGKILERPSSTYYRTNLDAFPGHSGSPVLNNKNEVIGILVRGYPESLIDHPRDNCNRFNTCDEEATACLQNDPVQNPGEHVQILSGDFSAPIP